MLIAANQGQFFTGAFLGIMSIYMCFFVFLAAIFLTLFVFWIVAIADISQRRNEEFPNPEDNPKATWLIILLVTLIVPFAAGISAVIYYATIIRKHPRGRLSKPDGDSLDNESNNDNV